MSFCDTYVLRIIKNLLDGDGNLFYENQEIQRRYHGADPIKLRKRLSKNLEKFINTDNVISNISLIILTYYTAFTVSDESIIKYSAELKKIKEVAEKKSYKDLVLICDKIPSIWLKNLEKHIELYK